MPDPTCDAYTEGSVGAIIHEVLLKQEVTYDERKASLDLTRQFRRPPTNVEVSILRQHARNHGLAGVPLEVNIKHG